MSTRIITTNVDAVTTTNITTTNVDAVTTTNIITTTIMMPENLRPCL